MENSDYLTVSKELTQFCIAKGVKVSPEMIEIQAKMILKRFSKDAILKALNDLFYECRFFPDASLIAEKIKKNCKVGSSKALATQEVNRILVIIKENGFCLSMVKRKLGEELYIAIGGCDTVKAYGRSNESELGTFKAQMRDAIEPFIAKRASFEKLKDGGAVANHLLDGSQQRIEK